MATGHLSILDPDNPCSLYNKAPSVIIDRITEVYEKDPDLILCDDAALKRRMPDASNRDVCVRLNFWQEYQQACDLHRKMRVDGIFRGVISKDVWYKDYLNNDRLFGYILNQPTSYENEMRRLLALGLSRFHEILTLPFIDGAGRVDQKAINNFLKAFEMVDQRIHGAVAQRLQIEQKSLNIHQKAPDTIPSFDISNLDTIEQKLLTVKESQEKNSENSDILDLD